MAESRDVIIIGGGLTGLTAAYVCQCFGFTPLLLEKSNKLGGGNKSIHLPTGEVFDSGYHTLDSGRSEITTKFFKSILSGAYREFSLKRGIVLRNTIIPYNASRAAWPKDLQSMVPGGEIFDPVTGINVERLEAVYGREFIHFMMDEVLKSYPHKKWALDNGGLVEDHLDFVYPWFFPKASKVVRKETEWDIYHDTVRNEGGQKVLYPTEGGFEKFVGEIEKKIREKAHEILTGVKEISLNPDASDHQLVKSVSADGREFVSKHILWCAPFVPLLKTFNRKVAIDGVPQEIVLGSFVLDHEIASDYHELLVGDPKHLINRVSFPGLIGGKKHNLVQVELYHPLGDYSFSETEWKEKWATSLVELGIVPSLDSIRSFHFSKDVRGFVTKQNFEKVSANLREEIRHLPKNLLFPFPMMGPENINRLIPETIQNVSRILAQ